MTGESKLAENGLRYMGFQMRIAAKRHRDEFNNLKHRCSHRKELQSDNSIYTCKAVRWTLMPCQMSDCPLLTGELIGVQC